MKKKIVRFSSLLLAVVITVLCFPVHAKAAGKTYTIALRSGQSGRFRVEAVQSLFPDAEVNEAYIKFTVARGENLSDYFASNEDLDRFLSNQNYLESASTEGGYYRVLSEDEINVTEGITRNADVVLDYCRVVNPARYVIEYINGENGADLAAPTFGFDEAGTEITAAPLAIAGFYTAGEETTLTLEEGKTLVVRFLYSQTETTVYNTEITYTEGDTVYNDIVNRTGGVNTVGGANGANANADAADADGEDANAVAIGDAETPLANNALEDNSLVGIDENETPLSNLLVGNTALFAIVAGVAILLALGVAATLKIKSKDK